MKNTNLHEAKKVKNDEFYTRLTDIEKELKHYKDLFKDKTVFMNCDDPEESNFWNYFSLNFEFLGLKRIISTHFDPDKPTYKLEIFEDLDEDGKIDKKDVVRIALTQNGDFRSPECLAILDECDIVVTNPPFSLFREYIDALMKSGRKFLVIGSMNAITYKNVFHYIKENKLWLGVTYPKEFLTPTGESKKFGNICWFTNLEHVVRNTPLDLCACKYCGNESEYPKYDNYAAIEVAQTKLIPGDYYGVMGVPISFLPKYCPQQFEIICQADGNTRTSTSKLIRDAVGYKEDTNDAGGCPLLGGKRTYKRILIKRRVP